MNLIVFILITQYLSIAQNNLTKRISDKIILNCQFNVYFATISH